MMEESKVVYIASPFAGEVKKNRQFAKEACRYCMQQGHTPIAPHLLYPQMLDDGNLAEREAGLRMGRSILAVCDEVWVCGDRISEGMRAEIALAGQLGIPVMKISETEIENAVMPLREKSMADERKMEMAWS